MNFYNSIEEMIGNTPLLRLNRIEAEFGLEATVLAKVEGVNPAGSAKDRVALYMIKNAEKTGRLKKSGVIIEPTSGNTGIALAAVAASRGYKAIIVMPDTMSIERRRLMTAYGAELVLSDGKLGMKGAIDKANEIAEKTPGSIIAGQFDNPDNPLAHYETTGPEIYGATDGKVDIFIAGIGTGGTITGTGKFLKEKNPSVRIIGIEPETSPLLSKGFAGAHGLQGIGANFVPGVLDTKIYDEIFTVSDEQAYDMGRRLAHKEGLLSGITSGAVAYAAVKVAQRPENKGKTIVALLPDTGERYLTTPMFAE